MWRVGLWTSEELVTETGMSPACVFASLHVLQQAGVVVCVSQQPLTYRHVNEWGEKGMTVNAEEVKTNELLAQLRKYERFVVEMLNMCTTFDVARLHARLKLFLQGANKCGWRRLE